MGHFSPSVGLRLDSIFGLLHPKSLTVSEAIRLNHPISGRRMRRDSGDVSSEQPGSPSQPSARATSRLFQLGLINQSIHLGLFQFSGRSHVTAKRQKQRVMNKGRQEGFIIAGMGKGKKKAPAGAARRAHKENPTWALTALNQALKPSLASIPPARGWPQKKKKKQSKAPCLQSKARRDCAKLQVIYFFTPPPVLLNHSAPLV